MPINKIPQTFLDDSDKIVKSTLKEILHLPADTPDPMIYTHRKYKSLGLFRVRWESVLQQINGLKILKKSNDPYIAFTRDLVAESKICLDKLKLTPANSLLNTHENFVDAHKVRALL